jgi:glycosyltransferase involved in cell wall biosynthesis
MDRANYALADFLARQHREIHLITHLASDKFRRRENVHIHRVEKIMDSFFLSEVALHFRSAKVARKLSRNSPIAMANGGSFRCAAVNWVHYVHSAFDSTVATNGKQRIKERLSNTMGRESEKSALGRAKLIICNSRRTQADLVRHLAIPESRTRIVYYGSDAELFSPVTPQERSAARRKLNLPANRAMALFVGALGNSRKGFDLLFSAWQTLCKNRSWDCDLAVAGAGPDLPFWIKAANECGIQERIHFLGFRKDIPEILAAADLMVHLPRYEAYGLGVHEALCRGVPTIVSAAAGVAERYPSELSGLLVRNLDDPRQIVATVLNWRENVEEFRAATVPLSSELLSYTWDRMATDISSCIDKAI